MLFFNERVVKLYSKGNGYRKGENVIVSMLIYFRY